MYENHLGVQNRTDMKKEDSGVETLKRQNNRSKDQYVDAKTLKHQNINKIRTTVYFPESEYRMLNEIYTRRLLSNQKTDKSALICEAIRLLYEKDEEM